MRLFQNNNVNQIWEKDEDELLQEFANSDVYKDHGRDEKIRLALFIAFEPPNGLGSTFLGHQFNKLWDKWLSHKWQFTMNNVQCTIKEK